MQGTYAWASKIILPRRNPDPPTHQKHTPDGTVTPRHELQGLGGVFQAPNLKTSLVGHQEHGRPALAIQAGKPYGSDLLAVGRGESTDTRDRGSGHLRSSG